MHLRLPDQHQLRLATRGRYDRCCRSSWTAAQYAPCYDQPRAAKKSPGLVFLEEGTLSLTNKMDIVPRIRDGTSLPQDTPFFRCSEEARYDGGGRDQFVTRFMDTLLKSPGQINAVVQSWLFFGTLVQYSDVFGTAFHDHAFIDRQPGESEKLEHTDIVHTEALGHLIETWTAICAQRFELSMISSKQYVTVNAYLREKRYLKDDKGNTGFNHAVAGLDILQNTYTCLHKLHEHGFEVNDIVWDSVVLLTCRLLNVFYFLFRGLWDPAFGERTVRLQQMLGWDIGTRHSMKLLAHNQWCPREVVILKSILDADPCTLLFCAQVDRSKSASLHTQCDESTCHAYQIDESIYETQHFFPECQCSFVGIAPEDEHKLIKPQTSSRLFKKGSGTAMMIWKEGLLEITRKYQSENICLRAAVEELVARPTHSRQLFKV